MLSQEATNALKILRGVSKEMLKHQEAKCGHDLQLEREEVEEFFNDDAMLDIPTMDDLSFDY